MVGQERFQEINSLLNHALEQKKVLIAVHRGACGGNIIENTIPSYETCLTVGGDMFECDLSMSTDGELYCFHDGNELRLLGRIDNIKTLSSDVIDSIECLNSILQPSGYHVTRFEEVLKHFTNGELFNIDRSWWYLPQLDALMQKYPNAIRQALIKTPVVEEYLEFFNKCPNKYMYMPIAYSMDEVRKVLSYPDINTVGVELIANSTDAELFQDENIRWIKEQGLFAWANTIVLSGQEKHVLYGRLDDDRAILGDPDGSWGAAMNKGIDVLQTDWPCSLYLYRRKKLCL